MSAKPAKVVIDSNIFVATFTIDPARRTEFQHEFLSLWRKFSDWIERDQHFCFFGWGREPGKFVAIEAWKSEEAVNALRATPEFQEAFQALLSFAVAPLTIELFNGLDAPRDLFDLYPAGVSARHEPSGGMHTEFL